MNDRSMIEHAAAAADRLALLAKALETVGPDGLTVLARLRDAQGGVRARNYEAVGRSMRADATFAGVGHDGAERDEADLIACIENAYNIVGRAWAILAAYPPAHHPTAHERAALGLADGPWCGSCSQVDGPDGGRRREPIHEGLRDATDVEGRLDEPMFLCRWCYGCVRDWGRVPTPAEVERHHRGLRVRWPDDVPRPA